MCYFENAQMSSLFAQNSTLLASPTRLSVLFPETIERVAVDLRTPAFSHGQFYVAMSRVTDVRNLTVLCGVDGGRRVENVVYPEALVQMP